jgi:LuxR family quorum-sensing system transcriptional regulator SinR
MRRSLKASQLPLEFTDVSLLSPRLQRCKSVRKVCRRTTRGKSSTSLSSWLATSWSWVADQESLVPMEPLDSPLTDRGLEAFLGLIRRRYYLGALIYFCPSFRGHSLADPFVVQVPCAESEDQCKFERCTSINPMLQASVRTLLPVHWTQRPRETTGRHSFPFATVEVCDDRRGISIPVRGPSNGMWAVLIAASTSTETVIDWDARRYQLAKELFFVARYVHQRVSDLYAEPEQIDLNAITKRENEALRWVAEGKTVADIAILMRISAETVKTHLHAARVKLGSLNRVHAVTKAFRAGLIS